jgi:hypothetical protein
VSLPLPLPRSRCRRWVNRATDDEPKSAAAPWGRHANSKCSSRRPTLQTVYGPHPSFFHRKRAATSLESRLARDRLCSLLAAGMSAARRCWPSALKERRKKKDKNFIGRCSSTHSIQRSKVFIGRCSSTHSIRRAVQASPLCARRFGRSAASASAGRREATLAGKEPAAPPRCRCAPRCRS